MRKSRIERLARRRKQREQRSGKSTSDAKTPRPRRQHVTFRNHRILAYEKRGSHAGKIMLDGVEYTESDVFTQEYLTRINHGIPLQFTDDAVAEAVKLQNNPPALPEAFDNSAAFATGNKRIDLTDLPFVTIDGSDAKDFDDAICVQEKDGDYVLWVAIADVSLYVKPKSAIDDNALERCNSYYFPNSVTPMLPEILSNDLCSLKPGVNRAVMAVKQQIRADGTPVKTDFAPAVIRSAARLTYDAVQNHYDGTEPLQNPVIAEMLDTARPLASALIERRDEAGYLDLSLPQYTFTVKKGKVTGVAIQEQLFSHRLIEAFMVVTNEAVARFLNKKGIPFPLRAHPAPDADKLHSLLDLLRNTVLGARMPVINEAETSPKDLAAVLAAAHEADKDETVSRLVLRSMMQARYVPGPVEGTEAFHYGLASELYCHFTSPIRRYADLMVHRALKIALEVPDAVPIPSGQNLMNRCDRCNEMERTAQEAEREVEKRLTCLLLRGHIGDSFEGIVTGILDFGFFVQPKGYPADGLIKLADVRYFDWFIPKAGNQQLYGSHTHTTITIGDRVTVQLLSVSVAQMRLDFKLLERISHRKMRRLAKQQKTGLQKIEHHQKKGRM